ncbi:MAG: nucleotidyltransferase family protein [Bacillota bacterium]|jgi:molybdenum cofactor cytidylyltransferase|nr:nucleotidyltransferase family protein [Bacillota bacterium]HOC06540.1 nucleotidyltransferase family protein [Bacillota bacterium]HPZ22099.1 nucleotidyltransferase family protein [Bacillota bacterium]HQD20019.1 nucleotidyltransferase family protein [Bacillota bacterium]
MLTAVILAAGSARRMGRLKQLLPWQGEKTILETVVETVLACPEFDDEVRVVLGAGRQEVEPVLRAIADPRLVLVDNPRHEQGMLSSIQRGVANFPPASQGFALFLGDQPLLTPALVAALARQWREGPPDFLVPVCRGRRGHPVFVHKKYLPEILAREDCDGGLRNLLRFHSDAVTFHQVDSPAVYIDLDYPHEYKKYRPKGE